MRTTHVFLPLVGLLSWACAPGEESAAASPPAQNSPAATADGEGLEPVTDWRSERKRLAMLGLAYDSGRAVPVVEEARDVLDGLTVADVPALLAEGQFAFDENRALDAIPLFTRAVLLQPEVADTYVMLGRSLQAFKLEAQAIAAWETGHDIDPNHAELTFRVADMAQRYGDEERALALYERTLELDPDHGPTWGRLARVRFFAGADDAAWQAVHRAEDAGEDIPAVLRERLAARSPEPVR